MSHDDFRLRVNTSTDKLNYVLHGTVNTAACVVVAAAGAPLLIGGGFLLTAAYNYFVVPHTLKKMHDELPPTPLHQMPVGSRDLPDFIRRAARDMGLPKEPSLYVIEKSWFERHSPSLEGRWARWFLGAFEDQFGRYMNAGAYGIEYPGIVVTTPLLERLSADEEKGVMAHEVMHLAGRHMQKQSIIGMLGGTARTAARLHFLIDLVSLPGAFAVAAGMLTAACTEKVFDKIGIDAEQVRPVTRFVATGALLGTLYSFGAYPLLAAWAVSRAMFTGTRLVEAHLTLRLIRKWPRKITPRVIFFCGLPNGCGLFTGAIPMLIGGFVSLGHWGRLCCKPR